MGSKDVISFDEYQNCEDIEELKKRLKEKGIVLEQKDIENLFHGVQLSKYEKIKELDLEEVLELIS